MWEFQSRFRIIFFRTRSLLFQRRGKRFGKLWDFRGSARPKALLITAWAGELLSGWAPPAQRATSPKTLPGKLRDEVDTQRRTMFESRKRKINTLLPLQQWCDGAAEPGRDRSGCGGTALCAQASQGNFRGRPARPEVSIHRTPLVSNTAAALPKSSQPEGLVQQETSRCFSGFTGPPQEVFLGRRVPSTPTAINVSFPLGTPRFSAGPSVPWPGCGRLGTPGSPAAVPAGRGAALCAGGRASSRAGTSPGLPGRAEPSGAKRHPPEGASAAGPFIVSCSEWVWR